MLTTLDKINQLLKREFPLVDPSAALDRQLSSLEIIALVVHLENAFKITVPPIAVEEANFKNAVSLARFVDESLARG